MQGWLLERQHCRHGSEAPKTGGQLTRARTGHPRARLLPKACARIGCLPPITAQASGLLLLLFMSTAVLLDATWLFVSLTSLSDMTA